MQLKTLLFASFILLSLGLKAQTQKAKQSALVGQYVAHQSLGSTAAKNAKFVYSQVGDVDYINAFIKVNEALDPSQLDELGVLVGTKAGNIWTLKVPTTQVEALSQLEQGLEAIELDQPIYSNMEEARAKTNVNMVHQGVDLPQAFTGKDVVVGILDVGFDYTHPTFYDETGTKYRVKRVWEQKNAGTPPAAYSYGNEIVDTLDMLVEQTDRINESHGSHVAGIAAGSGFGADDHAYRGVAYESDLVLVGITPAQEQWLNTGMTDIVDGLNYIFDYAASEGKAAVANLSWGCTIGPHDGSSLFSQAVDNLTGAGKIFTLSAGNNGDNKVHIDKTFSDADTLLQTFASFSTSLEEKRTWLDFWGEAGQEFCIAFSTYSGINENATSDFICLDEGVFETFLVGSDGDTLFVNGSATTADINGKPHIFLDVDSRTNNRMLLTIKATSGRVDGWMGYVKDTRGHYGSFSSGGLPWFSSGDKDMTIGEMGCTQSAITVGAYASKISFTSINGQTYSYDNFAQLNEICPFSSKGPTTDGRVKPDITAPGLTLASAFNSFDSNNIPGGSNTTNLVHNYTDANGHNYYYGEALGTSMSAPMVAGIVALVLEAKPTATPAEIKQLMAQTAITDQYTTDEPDPSVWGAGKIDAHALIQSILMPSATDEVFEHRAIYPNPTQGLVSIDVEGVSSMRLINVYGQLCEVIAVNENTISLGKLDAGIYFLSLYNEKGALLLTQKLIKL